MIIQKFNGNHILYNATDNRDSSQMKAEAEDLGQSCGITKEKVYRICAEYTIEK